MVEEVTVAEGLVVVATEAGVNGRAAPSLSTVPRTQHSFLKSFPSWVG